MAVSQPELQRIVQDAVGAVQRGDLARANDIATAALAAGAEHPFLLKVQALWLNASGQYRDALRVFHHARTLTPDDPSILNGIAGCLAGMGACRPALKIIDQTIRLSPRSAAAHQMRGWILDRLGDLPAARAAYERALALSPNFPDAAGGAALAAAQTNDLTAARALAARALSLSPRQLTARIALAIADTSEGKAEPAKQALLELIATDGVPPRIKAIAWGALTEALEALGQAEEAAAAKSTKDELMAAEPPLIDEEDVADD
jgi:Flp pilus assembly protein TadD